MMLSCRAASRLISQAMDRPLTRVEQGKLGLHLFICSHCRAFRQQMDALRAAARRAGQGEL